ncbi:MAG TPA: LuxR C-terminal-related transcriptional regulator [Chloroflexaceae bacterium]|nr:LuxR C-terminal-related transcriptional regulator [Chloroflexaceae bacterium]
MDTPLLSTKLYLPPPRPGVVRRARLFALLDEGLRCELTVVSAPAGFGKTTLLSDWLAHAGRPAAWLSLDGGERSPSRLLTYLIAALQCHVAGAGAAALAALRSAQPPPTEALLIMLLNDLAGLSLDVILVLDDYHTIDSPPVGALMALLIERLPPRLRLVIAGRADPDLPLARLRARHQLRELRAADLRFTADEAATFLRQSMGLAIAAPDVATLDQHTEGWAVGLQLAALALQGRPDPSGYIQTFSGGHRFVLDYLVSETLARQPEPVRRFLLSTSVLDRLSGPLCDAVTGEPGGQATLAELDRGNLFVVALDDERHWYRYHHLFAEALRALLEVQRPDEAAALQRRAALWFDQHGLPHEAIRYALAAAAFEQAAELIERVWPAMDQSFQSDSWIEWARALPERLVQARPILCLGYGWALLNAGDLEGAEPWLRRAEGFLSLPEAARTRLPVADPAQLQTLAASVASARAFRALALGDIHATLRYTAQVLDADVDQAHPSQIQAAALRGIAQWAGGDLAAADRSLRACAAGMLEAGRAADAIGMAFILGEIRITLGQLHGAFAAYEHAFQLIDRLGFTLAYGVEDLHRGLADLYRERGDLVMAERHLATGEELGARGVTLPDWRQRLHAAQARLLLSRGDLAGALERLDLAEHHFIRTPLPEQRPLVALRARVCIRQGDLEAAVAWARGHGVSADDPPSFLREFEQITLARLLIARARAESSMAPAREALELLGRLLRAAEDGGRLGSAIEILILEALAHHVREDAPAALEPLRRALELAELEGYVSLFVDEGAPMVELLRIAERRNIAPAYTRRLLAALGAPEPQPRAEPALADPLTEREIAVLRLLGTELSGPEIARALVVSLNTLRSHTKSIYGKLGVRNRRAALRRAAELGLV